MVGKINDYGGDEGYYTPVQHTSHATSPSYSILRLSAAEVKKRQKASAPEFAYTDAQGQTPGGRSSKWHPGPSQRSQKAGWLLRFKQ